MALTHKALLIALLLAPAATLLPTVVAETTTSTICYGGATDASARRVSGAWVLEPRGVDSPTYYVTTNGYPMWEESNGKAGLQQTDRVCTERTIENGVIVASRSWVDTPADTKV